MLATEWGMNNVLWTMFAFLIWCMAIWIFITVFATSSDEATSAVARSLWILLIVVVPFFGALVYLIARPRITDTADTRGASSYASSNPVPGGPKACGWAESRSKQRTEEGRHGNAIQGHDQCGHPRLGARLVAVRTTEGSRRSPNVSTSCSTTSASPP